MYIYNYIYIPEDLIMCIYIYNYINILLMVKVGKYSSPVDPMCIFKPNINGSFFWDLNYYNM